MNFDFSPEVQALKDEARKVLRGPTAARAVMDSGATHDAALWAQIVALGWTGMRLPEAAGGLGLSPLTLCALSEEVGRALAPVPFAASVVRGTEALLLAGDTRLAAGLIDGSVIVATAFAEGRPEPPTAMPAATVAGGRLSGSKLPVADGLIATHAVLSARADDDGAGFSWWLADLGAAGVTRRAAPALDLVRPQARLDFADVPVQRLGEAGAGQALMERWLQAVAVYEAFEALGTAEAAMAMAVDYAGTRRAFGRAIGGYQAVKHRCADMYIRCVLARGHAYYGAWALSCEAPELAQAAAAARLAALDALVFCAAELIQLHGGIGFTWDSDCQLFYRRSRLLALNLGSKAWWTDRLVRALEQRNAA